MAEVRVVVVGSPAVAPAAGTRRATPRARLLLGAADPKTDVVTVGEPSSALSDVVLPAGSVIVGKGHPLAAVHGALSDVMTSRATRIRSGTTAPRFLSTSPGGSWIAASQPS